MRAAAMVACLLLAAPAAAQSSSNSRPGPYVVDLRGVAIGAPTAAGFYPGLEANATVPSRGFGFEIGAHVYLVQLGPARLGVGSGFLQTRATSAGITTRTRAMTPQLSFNFGTGNGWSYLSAGMGRARVRTDMPGSPDHGDSGNLRAINAGGGARWFVSSRLAIGFDVRVHKLPAGGQRDDLPGTPAATLVSASVGVSVR